MSRRRYSTVSVSVDVSDMLDEIETEELQEELKRRGGVLSGISSDWVDRLRYYLDRGDIHGARAMLVSEEVLAMVGAEARAAQYAQLNLGKPSVQ